ncbi:MAG TPA: response regulator [Xanthobacteraceae bacterium]|nr:response regulator [Xanthobacteraceae bacterium]
MTRAPAEIFVVDDDPSVREALTVIFSLERFGVRSFADGASFVEVARGEVPDAVLLDLQLPGASGLEVLKELDARNYPAPIFIISGQGNIPMAVDAMKRGAVDFIEKPFNAGIVVSRVREEIKARENGSPAKNGVLSRQFTGHERLTPREREVLGEIAAGASNKEAGSHLGISPRTVEVHRARIMEKLAAKNAADLVRIVFTG